MTRPTASCTRAATDFGRSNTASRNEGEIRLRLRRNTDAPRNEDSWSRGGFEPVALGNTPFHGRRDPSTGLPLSSAVDLGAG